MMFFCLFLVLSLPRQWSMEITNLLKSQGLLRSKINSHLFHKPSSFHYFPTKFQNISCITTKLRGFSFSSKAGELLQQICFIYLFLFIYFWLFKKFIYLFIFGCVESLLLHTGFLQLPRAGATLPCGAWASHCGGFSCCGARALGVQASVVVAHGLSSCGSQALEHRLSSCGAWAQLLHSMWDLPGLGPEPLFWLFILFF